MTKSPEVNGLHLWAVKTNYSDNDHLWITTGRRDAAVACKKALAFTRKHVGRAAKVHVLSVENHGTLDA